MVDTIKCQTEDDLTELFFKKLLLGAIDKHLDHEETIAAPGSPYNNYTHRQSLIASEDQQHDEGNPRAKFWREDQRLAESSHRIGHPHSAPKTATLDYPYNTPNHRHQPPRFFTEPGLPQTTDYQQPFQERPSPFQEDPLPRRLTHSFTTPPNDTIEERPNFSGKSPRHRISLGLGLNKILRGHQDQ